MEVKYFTVSDIPYIQDEICILLGYFDGLHIGHVSLINEGLKSKYKKALLTFDFSDNVNIKNKNHITSIEDKKDVLAAFNFDYLLVLKFDNELMNFSAEEFVNNILLKLNVKETVVGIDYTFGKNKSGNVETLKSMSKDRYNVKVVDEVIIDEEKVSTSKIISLIENGNISKANQLLSRIYKISGKVKVGYKFGNLKKVPTANIDINGYIKPKNGVYATLIRMDEKIYKGVTNVGVHPSINVLDEPIIETYIFDFNEDIYDEVIDVYFIDFIREEIKFDNVDELYNQLENDKEKANELLDRYLNSFSKIVPFVGVDNYFFNTLLDDFKNDNLIDDVDVSLIGPTFEIDNHLYQVTHNKITFSFDKATNALVEMDITTNDFGALKNGIQIGMSYEDAIKLDSTLRKTDIVDVYVSNEGYVLVFDKNLIQMIMIFERKMFDNLCLYNKERERRDNLLQSFINEKANKYFSKQNSKNENILLKAFELNLDATYTYIKDQDVDSLYKLSKVLHRLINENNYFESYQTNENEVIREMILYINKKVRVK